MQREFLHSKIHQASVTERNLHYVGSISIDIDLARIAGILPNEKVEVYNITNGARFTTYTLIAPAGSGTIGLNGAAAHKVAIGDQIIIVTYVHLTEKEIEHHQPHVVVVESEDNLKYRILED